MALYFGHVNTDLKTLQKIIIIKGEKLPFLFETFDDTFNENHKNVMSNNITGTCHC